MIELKPYSLDELERILYHLNELEDLGFPVVDDDILFEIYEEIEERK